MTHNMSANEVMAPEGKCYVVEATIHTENDDYRDMVVMISLNLNNAKKVANEFKWELSGTLEHIRVFEVSFDHVIFLKFYNDYDPVYEVGATM